MAERLKMKNIRFSGRHAVTRVSAFVLAIMIGLPAVSYADTVDTTDLEQEQIVQSMTEEPAEQEDETLIIEESPEEPLDEALTEAETPEKQEEAASTDAEMPEEQEEDLVMPEEQDEPGEETPVDEDTEVPEECTCRQFVTNVWMNFKNAVGEERLPQTARPYWLRMYSTDTRIHLSWTDVLAKGADIDGYIVLRRGGTASEYEEIASVSSHTPDYIDDTAAVNAEYHYCVVGYKADEEGVLQVSEKSRCVVCVRGDSNRFNTYAPDSGYGPAATINKTRLILDKTGTAKLKLYFPDGALSDWVRWRSYDKSIATVDSNGVVSAVKPGRVKIAGRTAAGWDVNCIVYVRGKTKVTGVKSKSSPVSGTRHYDTVYVTVPHGRTLYLDMYQDGKWVKTKSYKLPAGSSRAAVKVYWPKNWWSKKTSKWRIRVPKSNWATAYKTPTITLTTKRRYQNPSNMIQISQKISKHGLSYYTSPVKVKMWSTRKDCVNAMIHRAYDYLGDDYVVCQSRQPGRGVDCSGIVMQACYASGIDLWPSNPYRHQFPKYEFESRYIWKNSKLQRVSWSNRRRGDLIFYANGYGTIIHIAIYLGNNRIIHSWPGKIRVSSVYGWGDHIAGVRRVFH